MIDVKRSSRTSTPLLPPTPTRVRQPRREPAPIGVPGHRAFAEVLVETTLCVGAEEDLGNLLQTWRLPHVVVVLTSRSSSAGA
jgi:hypothetical protein